MVHKRWRSTECFKGTLATQIVFHCCFWLPETDRNSPSRHVHTKQTFEIRTDPPTRLALCFCQGTANDNQIQHWNFWIQPITVTSTISILTLPHPLHTEALQECADKQTRPTTVPLLTFSFPHVRDLSA